MKIKHQISFLMGLFNIFYLAAQAPAVEWQQSLGGSGTDIAKVIEVASDGGYIVAGFTKSNDGDVTENHSERYDFWVVKLTSDGNIQWQKTLGGTEDDFAKIIRNTPDGGYIVAGDIVSSNGDVTGTHGYFDYWVVKLSSSGNIEWQKAIGTASDDTFGDLQTTADGGYILIGSQGMPDLDFRIVKLDSSGNIQWRGYAGQTVNDSFWCMDNTPDGGYILAGYQPLDDANVDVSILKLSSTGIIEWETAIGGSQQEYAYSIKSTPDGGYIVAGKTGSNEITGNTNLGVDYYEWVVKLSSTGTIQWQRAFGELYEIDSAKDIQNTPDGGYIVAGSYGHNSFDNNTYDSVIVKLNATGTIQWQKVIGGSQDDIVSSIQCTGDGGFIIAGSSSSNDGDANGNHGMADLWVVKLAPENLSSATFIEKISMSLFPNPAQNSMTLKTNYYAPSQEIIITDISGKTISKQNLEGITTQINTANFKKGVYFLSLKNDDETTTQKFIIE